MKLTQKLVLAHILNPINDKKLEYFSDGAMLLRPVKVKGEVIYKIAALGNKNKVLKLVKTDVQVLDYSDQLVIPSFFDMHFHWVQDDVRTMPKDNLLNWLDKYTFPAEAKFKNKNYAKKKAKTFFKRLASTGTLGGACFSSVHGHALEYAMEEAIGDLVIGNVLMTMNSPKSLIHESSEAVNLVKKLSAKYREKYCLTPRFAIATDPHTMTETVKLAKKHKCFMQSHLSETKNEINFVLSMYRQMQGFEKVGNYTEIYHKVGMLNAKSIMGHGIHLAPEELRVLAKTKTAIAHCPTSNAPKKQLGLGSGLFDFKQVEKLGVRWALGSDIGGGPFLSMLDVMRSFVEQNEKAGIKGATYTKALYRATLAGAEILGVARKKGNLAVGKEANFTVFRRFPLKATASGDQILAQLISRGRKNRKEYDTFADQVFYQGNLVFSSKA